MFITIVIISCYCCYLSFLLLWYSIIYHISIDYRITWSLLPVMWIHGRSASWPLALWRNFLVALLAQRSWRAEFDSWAGLLMKTFDPGNVGPLAGLLRSLCTIMIFSVWTVHCRYSKSFCRAVCFSHRCNLNRVAVVLLAILHSQEHLFRTALKIKSWPKLTGNTAACPLAAGCVLLSAQLQTSWTCIPFLRSDRKTWNEDHYFHIHKKKIHGQQIIANILIISHSMWFCLCVCMCLCMCREAIQSLA